MGLDESVQRFIGRLVCVLPHEGFGGWTGPHYVPPVFKMRLTKLLDWKGEIRGGIGRVEEEGHPYDGYWATFPTRHDGTWNFTDAVDDYNVWLSGAEPSTAGDDWLSLSQGGDAAGFASIAEDEETYWRDWEKKRAHQQAHGFEVRRVERFPK